MKSSEKPIANPSVVLREEFDDWAVLFDPETGRGFGLNPTGVLLWKLLDGGHTPDALLEKIRAQADNLPEDVSDHIGAFVDALIAEGLAGFDVAQFGLGSGLLNAADNAAPHPEKFSYAPPRQAGEVKRFVYEPPKLIYLSGDQAAYGANCTTGSQATNTCTTGNLACSCSSGTGRAVACCTGACDGVPCGCGSVVDCGWGSGASGGCSVGEGCTGCTNGPWAGSCSTGQGT